MVVKARAEICLQNNGNDMVLKLYSEIGLLKGILSEDYITNFGKDFIFFYEHFEKKDVLTQDDMIEARREGRYTKGNALYNKLLYNRILVRGGDRRVKLNKNKISNFDWVKYLLFIQKEYISKLNEHDLEAIRSYRPSERCGFLIKSFPPEKTFNDKITFIKNNIDTLYEELEKDIIPRLKERFSL